LLAFDPLKGFFSGGKRIEHRRLDARPKSLDLGLAVCHGAFQSIESQIACRDGSEHNIYLALAFVFCHCGFSLVV